MFSNDERHTHKYDIDGFDGIENGIFHTSVRELKIAWYLNPFSDFPVWRERALNEYQQHEGHEYVKKPICMVLNDRWNQFYVHHACVRRVYVALLECFICFILAEHSRILCHIRKTANHKYCNINRANENKYINMVRTARVYIDLFTFSSFRFWPFAPIFSHSLLVNIELFKHKHKNTIQACLIKIVLVKTEKCHADNE